MTLLIPICVVLATLAVLGAAFAIERRARRRSARVDVLLLALSQVLRPALAAGRTSRDTVEPRRRQAGGES